MSLVEPQDTVVRNCENQPYSVPYKSDFSDWLRSWGSTAVFGKVAEMRFGNGRDAEMHLAASWPDSLPVFQAPRHRRGSAAAASWGPVRRLDHRHRHR